MKKYSIPIIFAITGHRDLREEDIPILTKKLRELFSHYQTNYPNTELILLSALAEGADMLVASIAKDMKVTLHVILPYQESEYLNSFDDESQKERFLTLKEYASKVQTLPCNHKNSTTNCYQILGEYLADNSNILIALWDGVDNGKAGGTSAVVKYAQEGFKINHFDALEGKAIVIIKTPRVSNPNIETNFDIEYEYLGRYIKGAEFDNMLKKIDKLNASIDIDKLQDNSLAKTYIKLFTKRARDNQSKYKNYAKILLIFTFIAIFCLEIMDLLKKDYFIIGYGVGLLVAFGIYHFIMRKGETQNNFVYSRGFSEALRVQNAWNHAKLDTSVSKYYLRNQHHKFIWLRTILKNLFYMDKKPFDIYDKPCSVDSWIDGQIEYFKTKSQERHQKLKRLEFWEKLFYRVGLIVLVIMFILFTLNSLGVIDKKFIIDWHVLVFISVVLFMIATFIGEKYIQIEGYKDDIYHFNSMLYIFSQAKKELSKTKKLDTQYKKIVYDLGLKALDENSKWVVLHDKVRVEPSLE